MSSSEQHRGVFSEAVREAEQDQWPLPKMDSVPVSLPTSEQEQEWRSHHRFHQGHDHYLAKRQGGDFDAKEQKF